MKELNLSHYEKGYLTAFFDFVILPDWAGDYSEDWYHIDIGEAVFDINVWLDEDTSQIVCVVYQTVEKDGTWTTDKSAGWFLREVTDADS